MSSAPGSVAERPQKPEAVQRRSLGGGGRIGRIIADPDIHRSTLSVFDQAVVSVTNFATSVIIGRVCAQEALGIYFLALTMVLFARGIQDQVISAPYTVYWKRRGEGTRDWYSGSTLLHQMTFAAGTMFCCLAVALLLLTGIGPAGLGPVMWILVGAVPFLLLREFIRRFAFAHLRVSTAIAIDVAVAALQIGGLLALAYFGLLSVVAVYCIMGAACAVACLGWFLTEKEPLRFSGCRVVPDWLHNWTFGKWTLAGQLAGSLAPNTLPWILVIAHGEAATGLLAACYTLIGLSNMFVNGVGNFFMPRAVHAFTEEGLSGLRHVLRKMVLIFTVGLGAFCLLVLATGDLLAVFVYGDQYTGCGTILTLLAFGAMATSIGAAAGNGLWAIEKPRANCIADVCMSTITLAVAIVTVYPLGVLGAALAAMSGQVAGAAVRCLVLQKSFATIQASRPQNTLQNVTR